MENSNYVGKRLDGRYEIMEVIGVGGMAVVYKAFDNMDQRIVAVKILKDEFIANEEFKRRFKNESKAIAVLSHENIVKVFDVSYGDKLQYIVMEYVDGITLKEYVQQQGKIDTREAIYYISQILRALQHAHDKGIVHRDVKPQNIMLQEDGSIKVTDFGIARFSRSETKTMTECAIGSVHYISPEQAKGNVTDAKTDLYAAGVILYEMLTGSLPFQSDNAVSVALMQLQNEPVMPRELNPEIAVGLEQIIMKAMQKNLVDRYQSASEMLFDINKYKENPNVKFNYALDSTGGEKTAAPEEVIPVIPVEKPATRVVKQKPVVNKKVETSSVEEPNDEPEIDAQTKKKTIMLLSGALIALVIFAAILISVFSSGNKNAIEVPLLEGLNYYDDVINNPAYANLNIIPEFKPESQDASGTIIEQNPKAEKKVDPGTIITIYIAGSSSGVEIPSDIIGKNFSTVETQLKALGLTVLAPVKEKSVKVSVGAVIRTEPQVGETVPKGSTITIYVATNEDVEPIEVPDLIGMTVSEAKVALEKVGLKLNVTKSEYRASTVKAGTIIGHEKVGEKVLPGTSIAVYVSNGQGVTTTADKNANNEDAELSTEAEDASTEESTTVTTTVATTTEAPTTETTTTEYYYEETDDELTYYEDKNDYYGEESGDDYYGEESGDDYYGDESEDDDGNSDSGNDSSDYVETTYVETTEETLPF